MAVGTTMADPSEVNRMCNALGVSREEALYYLEGFDWDLASAMEACLVKTLPPVKVKSSPEVSVIEKSTAAESSATRVTINPPRISNQGSSTPSRTIDSRRSSNQNHVGVRIDSRRSWNQVPNPPKELSSELKKESIDRFREVAYGMSLQEVVTFLERFNWDVNIAVNHFMDQRNPQYTSDDVDDLPTIEYLQRLPENYIPMIGVSNLEGFSQEETSAVLAAEMMEHRGPPLPSLSSQSQFHASLGCDLGSSSSSGNSSVDKLRQPRSNASTLRPGPNRDPNSFRTRIPGVVSAFGSLGRMSPVVPFPDLNLMPDSQSSTAGTTAGETVVTGKLEVKAEPIEEWQTPPSYCSDQSATNDLLAEFTRISKLFRSAFKPRQVEGLDGVSVYGLDSGAIVAVPDEDNRELIEPPPGFGDNRVSSVVVSPPPPPRFQRPRELARIANLGHYQRKQLRQVMKRTRMTYESLRVHLVAEDMKHPVLGQGRKRRSDMTAAYMMRDRGLWLNYDKHIVGPITGVEIGDTFFYRMELCVVGLHGQTQAGIDCLTADRSATKEPIATSIIVSGGYEDDEDTGEVLIYTGHGGQDKQHKQCQNQRLEGGNLGMERSMHYGIEVRVIRGIKYENSISSKVYVYDGLYKIVDCWFAVGKSGFGVFKFRLVRMEGQPMMGSAVMKFARTLRSKPWVVRPTGYVSFDISNKKENVPVYLYNDIDGDQEPRHYEYIAKSVFPPGIFGQGGINRTGCDCNNSCTDDCICARKNGGEFAYDDKGHLLRGKHVVFECGEFCKCGPGCKSRVTQKGLRNRLEVFRSKETGWGVRTLDLIEAGAFICEYAGVVVTRHQADILSMNGDVMVYPGRFTDKWGNWGDLSQVYPGYVRPNYPSLPPLDFAMDVSKMRNVACYISHNKEPNVMVQFVLYDHNHLMFPRVMLFALENISPLAELSLDYGLADEVNGKLAICN